MARLIELDETETSYFDEIRSGGGLDDDEDDIPSGQVNNSIMLTFHNQGSV